MKGPLLKRFQSPNIFQNHLSILLMMNKDIHLPLDITQVPSYFEGLHNHSPQDDKEMFWLTQDKPPSQR
jgi:hypothetical protein